MPGPPALTHRLWGSIAGLYDQIIAHPFLAGLADGSLDQDKFRFYVVQDARYLREYARALSVCGARAPAEDDVAMFNQHAAGAIAVERELHAGFLADFGLTPAEVEATPMAPTNRAYTSYLLASVYAGSFPEALAAVLPCYWIYAEVGVHLLRRGSPDPLYRRWIDTYGGEEFAAVVQAVRDLTDRVGADLAGPDLARVFERFATTSRYEWMFWDAAWRQERWPV
jgi:thiaminase (transcriptional activator TenA)